ncbi:MAG TPA: ABC transporter permease [Pyrinomonadaceae bacterium]|nr:ABC transporter permease [Pyrinomonadaceae bacterium]
MSGKSEKPMPDWQDEIRQRLAALKLAPAREAEIVEELTQHLGDRYEDLLTLGHTPESAFHTALAELLQSDLFVRELRRVERRAAPEPVATNADKPRRIIAGIWQDGRYGARSLLKQPGFTAVVVLTLALGIGANTALFSVVNGVLLKPLPYPHPEQLVTLHQSKPNFQTGAIPYPNFRDLQSENQTFSAMAISRGYSFSLIGVGAAERISARLVSADFFTVLAVNAAPGRTFMPGEDEVGAGAVVLISADLWQRKFGSAEDVLGKSLTLDDKNYTIIGVIPASFNLVRNIDVYVPIGQWNNPALRSRSVALGLHGIGRLKPGVTIEQAQADLDRVMRNLAAAYPETNRGNGAKLISLEETLVGDIRPILWTLLGAVAFVLLIACVNVSNLMLARSTGRTRDFAIRAALGASQWRLLRQSLIESLLLALVGGGLALVVAGWGTKAALSLLPTMLPRAEEVGLDTRVLIFAVAISLITGILSGLAPALKTSQWHLTETLKEGGRGASSGRGRAQGIFVAVEMALALVLLIGAGLMIRSLTALWNVDPGFRSDNVLTFGLNLPPALQTASPNTVRTALRDLSDKLGSMPGVRAVSFSAGGVPLQGEDDLFFWLEDRPKPASQSEMNMALVYRVEPGYLTTMSIPLKRGRFFNDQDHERAQPVVVIDEVFARKYFGEADPVGKRIQQEGQDPQQIVGVVGHVKQWSIDADEEQSLQAQLYEPFRQLPDNSLPSSAGVLIRSENTSGGGGPALFESIRRIVQSQNSQNVIFRPQTMNEVIADTLAARRFSMIVLDAFAVVALLLASVGLYGVISYLVGQRTHELGIRIALGAQSKTVLRLVLGQGMKMALAGVVLGLVAAVGLTRLLARMLYGVSTTDPLTFAAIALLLISVAMLACIIPARRASRVDPLIALRYE